MSVAKKPVALAQRRDPQFIFHTPAMKLILVIGIPIFVSQLILNIYNIVDTMWVARIDRLNPVYVSAVGTLTALFVYANGIVLGCQVGVTIFLSRALGGKREELYDKVFPSALVLTFSGAALILGVLYGFAEPLVNFFNQGRTDLYELSLRYYLAFVPSIALAVFAAGFSALFVARGHTKIIMFATLFATLLNFILDPIFIFPLKMGIMGAGVATSISQGCVAIFLLTILIVRHKEYYVNLHLGNISLKVIGSFAKYGFTMSLNLFGIGTSILLLYHLFITKYASAFPTVAIYMRFDALLIVPMIAISSAFVPILGQNLEAGFTDRIRELWWGAHKVGVICFAVELIVMLSCGPFLFHIFSEVPSIIALTIFFSRIALIGYFAAISNFLTRSLYQVMGFFYKSLFFGVLRSLLLVTGFALIAGYVFDATVKWVFFAEVLGNFTAGLVSLIFGTRLMHLTVTGKVKARKLN